MDQLIAAHSKAEIALRRMRSLWNAGHLTPEIFEANLKAAASAIAEAKRLTDQMEAPQFELTLEGYQALGALPKARVRFAGPFQVIDGGRA
jgi:hypothetical protein